jgi:hypothetical protein
VPPEVLATLADYVEAQAKGNDVVVPCHEDPRDLVVRREPGYRAIARGRNGGNGASPVPSSLVGNWTCTCGQQYRVAARGSRILLWPRNSATGFRTQRVTDTCVRGCAIDGFEVVRAIAGRRAQTAASL